MRILVQTIAALGLLASTVGFAQDAGQQQDALSEADARIESSADPEATQTDERELSRAERRALRRSQRAAAAESEQVVAEAGRVAGTENAGGEDDDGVICRREAVTGSHRRVRICTTRAEREAMRESYRETMRDVLRTGPDFGLEGVAAGLE